MIQVCGKACGHADLLKRHSFTHYDDSNDTKALAGSLRSRSPSQTSLKRIASWPSISSDHATVGEAAALALYADTTNLGSRRDGFPEHNIYPRVRGPPEDLRDHYHGVGGLRKPSSPRADSWRELERLDPPPPQPRSQCDPIYPEDPTYPEDLSIVGRPIQLKSHSGMPLGLRADEYEEVAQIATETREQQSDGPFQEGTIADSGYVSACVSRSINHPNLDEKPREYETMEPPEAPSQLTVDQQTVYTSSFLPHGSDHISDLCNDIHMKLKYELQEHTHDRARIELPKCLPDLIKAFSIRIGLDTSEPSTAYIMHFLHTNYR